MRGLRVGLLAAGWSPDPGGVERVSSELAAELLRRGHAVFALALDTSGELRDGDVREQRVAGVRLRRVGWSFRGDERLSDLARTPAQEARVVSWSRDHELDLVHLQHLSGWGLGVAPRLAELGTSVLWTLHDYWSICPRGQMLHVDGQVCERAAAESCGDCAARTWPQLAGDGDPVRALERRLSAAREAFAACSKLYVPTRAALEVFTGSGIDTQRWELCENGLASRERREPREHGGVLRVGVLGSVQPSKGVLELARWIVELPGIELHVHGPCEAYHGDRSYLEALQQLAARSPDLHLHGAYAHQELPSILGALDLVCVPSLWKEVHGLTAREARAAGLPVFASEVGGLAEGPFERLPAGDRDAWCAALERFATDVEWRRSLAESAAILRTTAAMADQLEADYVALVRAATRELTS